MKPTTFMGLLAIFPALASGAISLSDSSTLWSVIPGNYDAVGDTQAGKIGGDIVGDETNNYGFFTQYDEVDDMIGFRIRMDEPGQGSAFSHKLWIGIDANNDGEIDVFVGTDGVGNNASDNVALHAPGTDLNTSPSTTSVASAPYVSYTWDSQPTWMDYREVAESDYAGFDSLSGDTLDVGGDLNTDWYVSFQIPFAQIIQFLADANANPDNLINIDETTPLRYVLATATQDNALNADLGGVTNPDDPWNFPPGSPPVPEPSSALLCLLGLLSLLMRRRRC